MSFSIIKSRQVAAWGENSHARVTAYLLPISNHRSPSFLLTHIHSHTHSHCIYGPINDTADWKNARADILYSSNV